MHPTKPTSVSSEPFFNYFKGVPQGAATSVSQSVLALNPLIQAVRKHRHGFISPEPGSSEATEKAISIDSDLVGYADDWVLYGERLDPNCLENDTFKHAGIEVSKEKSG
jgi:hypothetical protein